MTVAYKQREKLYLVVMGLCAIAFINIFTDWRFIDIAISWAAPIGLIWLSLVMWYEILHVEDKSTRLPHRRANISSWLSLYFLFRLSYGSIAYVSTSGFQLLSLIGVALTVCLIGLLVVEIYFLFNGIDSEPEPLMLVIGLAIFIYHSYGWHKEAYVTHYGVPIIGHYLEKPYYDAQYYAEITRIDNDSYDEYTVLADIHVNHGVEEVGSYEDRYGQERGAYSDVHSITVKRFKFASGGWIDVDYHDESIDLDDGGVITDKRGRSWMVRILKDRIQN